MTLFTRIITTCLALGIFTGGPAVYAAPAVADPLAAIIPCQEKANCTEEVYALPQARVHDELLPGIARFLVYALTFVGFAMFSYAGILMVFSYGSEDAQKKMKYIVIWGITAFVFAAGAYILVRGILNLPI